MGDMADYDIQEGMDMWFAHQCGECFEDCRYCYCCNDEGLDECDE